MKKLFILGLASIMMLQLSGCSVDPVEKEPVIISDTTETNLVTPDLDQQETDVIKNGAGPEEDGTSKEPITDQSDGLAEDLTEDNKENPSATTDPTTVGSDQEKAKDQNTYQGIILLEGMEEEVTYQMYKSDLGYQIAYDIDRFTVTKEKDNDTFMAENPNPELYPYVYFSIGRNEYTGKEINLNDSDLHLQDDETGKDLVANAKEDTVKIGDYDAIHWKLIDGNEWNSLVKHYYYIKGDKYYYWIKTNYFLEASEGYGSRISAMLDTFVIE